MTTGTRPLWVVLASGLTAVSGWRGLRPDEPRYRGHSISYWIEPWQHHGTEPPEAVAAAFAEIDAEAARQLGVN